MLSFHHNQKLVQLQAGESWAAPHAGENYQDTSAENLWAIIGEVEKGRDWREVVTERYGQNHPWLHQIITNPSRDLFLRQYPPSNGARILDVGAGWGQISLPLARKNGIEVTALEPTPERLAFIRAAAVQEKSAEHIYFIRAGFQEILFEPVFDLVCCIGVLEWVPKFQSGHPRNVQREFLTRLRSVLRPGGKCYVGIENRFGLKYLLGARDDHTGLANVSVLEAMLAGAKHQALTGQELRAFTYTQVEYEALFHEAGFTEIKTYAAFPDYKLPQLILPCASVAELNDALLNTMIPQEHDGINGQLLLNPDLYTSHYRSLARLGIAQYFCPSFFFILQ